MLAVYKASLLRTLQQGTDFTKKNFDRLGAFSNKVRELFSHTASQIHRLKPAGPLSSPQDQKRSVSVTADCRSIMWVKKGSGEYNDIVVADITEVIAGASTTAFKNAKVRSDTEKLPHHC